MNGGKPSHLCEIDPRARFFPSEWKDEAVYLLFNTSMGGVSCSRCERTFSGRADLRKLQGDHIIPWSRGGATDWGNMQLLCSECNRQKGNL